MTRRALVGGLAAALLGTVAFVGTWTLKAAEKAPEWSLNATAIEACSCPMFCQCYFNSEPAEHPGHGHSGENHFCRFNMAYKVNQGHHGDTRLDGALFWIAGDLGSGWDDGVMEWARVHFDPGVTEAQRQGILAILGHLFPVEWSSFEVGDELPVRWQAEGDRAVGLLDDGKAGEIRLAKAGQTMTDDPALLTNIRYWGAPRHDGFVMMPNEVEAYRLGPNAFEFQGTNGFMITIDIDSDDVAEPAEE